MASYDTIGIGYARNRQPDPRWAAAIHRALGDARSVLNVGAGAGSYEPRDTPVVALEPSAAMIAQRPGDAAPVLCAIAEALPIRGRSFDAAMAVLTVHHWTDYARGLAELRRVSARQIVLTWNPGMMARFWLVRDYLPEIGDNERELPAVGEIAAELAVREIIDLPVPHDCTDGFLAAYWRRPEAYLDPAVRASISALALLDAAVLDPAMARLAEDLRSGAWKAKSAGLLAVDELDAGYRLVVAGG